MELKLSKVLLLLFTFSIANPVWAIPQKTPPSPWTKVASDEGVYSVWGREYIHGSDFLPRQIVSSGTRLLARPITLNYQIEGDTSKSINIEKTGEETHEDGMRFFGKYEDDNLIINAKANLEYDGFYKFDISLIQKTEAKIAKLATHISFLNKNTTRYNKFLEYDFIKQNVIPTSDIKATGEIPASENFHFNPTIWIGHKEKGLELVHETNIPFKLNKPEATHSLSRNNEFTQLITRVIDSPVQLKTSLDYSFALVVTPTKPRNINLAGLSLTSKLPKAGKKDDYCCTNQVYIGHWKRTPLHLPGIPLPAQDKAGADKYATHREKLQQAGVKYVPYSSLYILPATLDLFEDNPDWQAAPARKGSKHWTEKLQVKRPIQPVSYHDEMFRNLIIDMHLEAQKEHGIEGIYFDVATMREVGKLTKLMASRLKLEWKPTHVYYPLYSHREFLKTYWKALKTQNPDFIIVHHSASFPKISHPFLDVMVIGESVSYTHLTLPTTPYV